MRDDIVKQGYSPEEEYFHRKNQEAIRKLKESQKGSRGTECAPEGEKTERPERDKRSS